MTRLWVTVSTAALLIGLGCGSGSTATGPKVDAFQDLGFRDAPVGEDPVQWDDLSSPDISAADPGTDSAQLDILPTECATDSDCNKLSGSAGQCREFRCDPASGLCVPKNLKDGTPCQAKDACAYNAECKSGECVGIPVNCDDGNPCTDDFCDPVQGCLTTPNSGPCDDGNPCTATDTCKDGLCMGEGNGCPCTKDEDCAVKEDGNLCNGTQHCSGGFCVVDPATVVQCPGDADVCAVATCTPATGKCVYQPLADGTPCDDGSVCTVKETCVSGKCVPGGQLDCDDDNPCTDDFCNTVSGCGHANRAGSCDDGNGCTTDDACVDGKCVGTPTALCGCVTDAECAAFEDGNLCNGNLRCQDGQCVVDPKTVISCDPSQDTECRKAVCDAATGTCGLQPVPDGRTCDDQNACTPQSECKAGACVAIGEPLPCNDGNPCTADACDPSIGCTHEPQDATCDDGNSCTSGDHCENGVCTGTEVQCPDDNPCTDDACVPGTGCVHSNNTAACDDGSTCTLVDRCENGICIGTSPKPCDDGNPCTDDLCDNIQGCYHVDNLSPCDDGDVCTLVDLCVSGKCTGGSPVSCDDSNPCTDDLCNPEDGCAHAFNTAPCDDLEPCSVQDACLGGTCRPGIPVKCDDGNPCTDDSCLAGVGCQAVPNAAACDDGNPCTTQDRCKAGACVGGPAPDCDDGNPCTDDACDPVAGQCVHKPNAAKCDDGNPCTTDDTCKGGTCLGGAATSCDDGNPCTTDACDPKNGCVYVNNTFPCDDGNMCTTNDACAAGKCVGGAALKCSDGNKCTDDSCDPAKGCVFTPNTLPCEDGSVCTTNDVCKDGVCKGGPYISCDDGNPCTTDGCQPKTGCTHTNNTAVCDDKNTCTTGDHCADGKCQSGATLVCDDKNPCTLDSCDPTKGCIYANNSLPCDDANACTAGDTCAAGKCVGGTPVVCEDNNPCTADACDPAKGCVYVTRPDGTTCDDGNACTTGDKCTAGKCVGSGLQCDDKNPCTQDTCDTTGGCVHKPITGPCDDGNVCTLKDTCIAGICTGQATLVCNDGTVCTDDSCDPVLGCVYKNNTSPCEDGNKCTTKDYCSGGKCLSGPYLDCNDNNVCTNDSCTPSTGCVHTPNTNPCDDKNACTAGDMCSGGVCKGQSTVVCDDKNPCTDDSCDPAKGCVYTPNTAKCDDGNACTTGDMCTAGACKGTGILSCDDKNPCTDDSCDPGEGCVNTANTAPCDDGNACTSGDRCAQGVCSGPIHVLCADKNVCTTDYCDPKIGCVYAANSEPCNDGKVCTTGDRCADKVCVGGPPPDCSDGNICTDDACVEGTGCVNTFNTAPCDDGNACTIGDRCGQGKCTGAVRDCNDGNPCTADGCNPSTGCFNQAVPDGLPCGTWQACRAGKCVPWEIVTSLPAGTRDVRLYEGGRPDPSPSWPVFASGSISLDGVVVPMNFVVDDSLAVKQNFQPGKPVQGSAFLAQFDHVIGGSLGLSAHWHWQGYWTEVAAPPFNAPNQDILAVTRLGSTYWASGNPYTEDPLWSTIRKCVEDKNNGFSVCTKMALIDTEKGCTRKSVQLRGAYAASATRVFFAGFEPTMIQFGNLVIASWNGNKLTACGNYTFDGAALYAQDNTGLVIAAGAYGPGGFNDIHGRGEMDIWAVGDKGSVFWLANLESKWEQLSPAKDLPDSGFGYQHNVTSVWVDGETGVHMVGVRTLDVGPTVCRVPFYLHAVQGATGTSGYVFNAYMELDKWRTCGTGISRLDLQDVTVDSATGAVYAFGWVPDSPSSPSTSLALVMRWAKP